MRISTYVASLLAVAAAVGAPVASAQTFAGADPVIRKLWDEGMGESQVARLAQVLSDCIGPRLTGSPGIKRGNDRLVASYTSWGVAAKNEQYGTWKGWRRGGPLPTPSAGGFGGQGPTAWPQCTPALRMSSQYTR